MKIQDKIIQAIKVILEAGQGLTQEQLAEILNTTNKSVSKWENG